MEYTKKGEGRFEPSDLLQRMTDDPKKYGNFAMASSHIPGDVQLMLPSMWIIYHDNNGVVVSLPTDVVGNALLSHLKKEEKRKEKTDEETKMFEKLSAVEQLEYLKDRLEERIMETKKEEPKDDPLSESIIGSDV